MGRLKNTCLLETGFGLPKNMQRPAIPAIRMAAAVKASHTVNSGGGAFSHVFDLEKGAMEFTVTHTTIWVGELF